MPGPAPRSFLYVPADRQDLLAKATARGADALILDLEDAVPAARKQRAREILAAWLASQAQPSCQLWVRVNPALAESDIGAVVTSGITGLVVPKAEAGLLNEVDGLLARQERAFGIEPGKMRVIPLIETAQGLLALASVAAAPRVARLGLGEADLCAELGIQPGLDGGEVLPIRLQIVVVSAAQRIGPPVGPTSRSLQDTDELRMTTQALLRLGFRARTAIHPAQIATINEVFTPSAAEVARARRLIEAFEGAEREGVGVITDEQGRMVDAAVVRTARETLARVPTGSPRGN